MKIPGPIWAALLVIGCGAQSLCAQFKEASDEIPPLRPPRAEMPPTFWDEHGTSVTTGSGLLVFLIAALILWLVFRPRKPVVQEPAAIQAHRALESLRRQPEDGAVLSRVSQILRRYVTNAFELPPGEMTTADLSSVMASDERFSGGLASDLTAFLGECDDRKFAPPKPAPAMDAVGKAFKLVDAAEARREQLARAAAATVAHSSTA